MDFGRGIALRKLEEVLRKNNLENLRVNWSYKGVTYTVNMSNDNFVEEQNGMEDDDDDCDYKKYDDDDCSDREGDCGDCDDCDLDRMNSDSWPKTKKDVVDEDDEE